MTIQRTSFQGEATAQLTLCGPSSALDELHICVRPTVGGCFKTQLQALEDAYFRALAEVGFDRDTVVFRRFFLSDAANQRTALEASSVGGEECNVAISIVEQPPFGTRKVEMWAYHVKGAEPYRRGHSVVVPRGELNHIFTCQLTDTTSGDSHEQTTKIFQTYLDDLQQYDCSLKHGPVRTWLFARDVDRNYAGLVQGRQEIFARNGLTPETHFIASTGIEGRSSEHQQLVLMDAYAISGLRPGQQRYLNAPHRLGPTSAYGVHFERGVRVNYRDRGHLLISGTASIEPSGRTVHVGEVEKQVLRACENVESLLEDGEAGAENMAQFILYLRDPADRRLVEQVVTERWPGVPFVSVHAPVCRPSWLVEIECMAWVEANDDRFPAF